MNLVSQVHFFGGYNSEQQKKLDRFKVRKQAEEKLKVVLVTKNIDTVLELFDVPKEDSPLFQENLYGDFGGRYLWTEPHYDMLKILYEFLRNPNSSIGKIKEIDELFQAGKPESLDVDEEIFNLINERLGRNMD